MSTFTLITNAYIQNPGEEKYRGDILIEGNKIIEVGRVPRTDGKQIDACCCVLTPGLIDQHIHGGYGCDFNTADVDTITEFLMQLPKHGITTVCPTVMTAPLENIKKQVQKIKQAKNNLPAGAAKIVGINLEGPFINPDYKGAHSKDYIFPLTIENYRKIEDEEIKIITIAPELDKNKELTGYLQDKNIIISAGHSCAENLYGLKHVTHLFNAMPPLRHRTPGLIGSSLVDDDVFVEVIADHNHLHPDIIKLIIRTKPSDKVIFVSDCLSFEDKVKKDDAAVSGQGNLIGSLILLDSVIRKNLNIAELKDLLIYCSLNPAKNLGLKSLGRIDAGMDADLVLWDEGSMEVRMTFVDGICVC